MASMSALSVMGERRSGQSIRQQNVMAAQSIANIVKSSLGPVGLDKMLVDDVGDVTVTNDGATILQNLEVEHPAAKVLCELADLQVVLISGNEKWKNRAAVGLKVHVRVSQRVKKRRK